MKEELLISLVQKYRELHDLGDPRYHDEQRRMNIWQEIAQILNETPANCKERWKRIRDNYRRAKKLRLMKSGQAATNIKPIRFEKELSFLSPFICNDTQQNLTNLPSLSDDEQVLSPRSRRGDDNRVAVAVLPRVLLHVCVRHARLHCQHCYSSDDGRKYSAVARPPPACPTLAGSASPRGTTTNAGSSPLAESAPNMYDIFEEPPLDLTAHICADSLRQSAHEQMRAVGGRLRLLDELETGVITAESVASAFSAASEAEKNMCLFWVAYLKLANLLPPLIEAGADPLCFDALGLTPLHVAAFSGSTECATFLLSRGCDPNYMPRCFTPLHCAAFGNSVQVANLLISRGASVHSAVKYVNCEGGLLHCAVRANSVECLKLFICHGVDVNQIEPGGTNAIHLAADLGMFQCLQGQIQL
ncbi:unnamed protein product [Arctia plantaginis]|uniref:Uncharacterized protein n=1 Tax=Arctia plantaginis TaxID=874455 RepID=A0A8S1B8W2_ARCPL|nr:unnamed protein product [Arctia plantaginis]